MAINPRQRNLRVNLRLAKVGWRALSSTAHPVLVHMVAMRRCNLACTYCNEYDRHSPPVPTEALLARVDKLAELGTSLVSLSGGEPLLHPELDTVIAHAGARGLMCELLTNAYLLTAARIEQLNRAGLARMQISIDNVQPDDASKKSLKVLDQKLRLLAEHAAFGININSVLGGGVAQPEDALVVARRARELGFSTTVGIIHDGSGALRPLSERERAIYHESRRIAGPLLAPFTRFKRNLAAGRPNTWRCRAGARYLYICEDGLVHYCSQQRGYPGTPLLQYTQADLAREFDAAKACAPHCTIGCVHTVAVFDNWRRPQRGVGFGGQGMAQAPAKGSDDAGLAGGQVEREARLSARRVELEANRRGGGEEGVLGARRPRR